MSGCCLVFASFFFSNFSLVLCIKVLLIKKVYSTNVLRIEEIKKSGLEKQGLHGLLSFDF